MPDPGSDAYHRYRDGLVKRHIVCSGRYLSELWLKQFEAGADNPSLLRYSRVFTSPQIPRFVRFSLPILGTHTIYDGTTVRVGPYFIALAEGKVTYSLPGIGSGELREPQTLHWGSYVIEFHPGQESQTRTYVPWLSEGRVVYGGGDNPLLRGGIAMATFAVEYLVKKHPSSLRYARRLLWYFERCEVTVAGKKTGFFLRCDNYFNVSGELGKHASTDELVGLMLGLYYLFLAAREHPDVRKRVEALVNRVGARLRASGYLLIPPTEPAELHRGFAATYVFQWAFQQAFQKITGNRFEPTAADYDTASARLYAIYQDSDHRLKYRAGKEKQQLLAIMYLWVKMGKITGDIASKWTQEFRQSIHDSNAFEFLFWDFSSLVGFYFDMLQDDLKVDAVADPFKRYLATIRVQDVMTFCRNYESWFNRAMTIHTLQYALDEEIIQANNDHDRAVALAAVSHSLLKTMLCGERYPKPVAIPPHYEVGPVDDDLYAAVVVKGLLARFIPIAEMKCYPIPRGLAGADMMASSYSKRVDESIAARSRMWEELPAGELWWTRNARPGWEGAPVRWHNSDTKENSRRGMDFCWERYPDLDRVLSWGRSTHDTATGLPVVQPPGCEDDETNDYPCVPSGLIKGTLDRKIDLIFEGGGLDFVFPRVLMSHWLGEPLEFSDPGQPLLRAIACLPFVTNGGYRKARCPAGGWLLLSSAWE